MKRPTDPEWLLKSLRGCYEMRDALDAIRAENPAPTTAERVAAASVRQTIDTWIAYYNKELTLIARRGGNGFPSHVERELASLAAERSGRAGGGCSRQSTQVHT